MLLPTKLKASIVVLSLIIAGCAQPPYKKLGTGLMDETRIGYEDAQINANTFLVSYTEFGDTASYVDAYKFMLRRAQEVCAEHGFRTYELSDKLAQGQSTGSNTFAGTNVGSVVVGSSSGDTQVARSFVVCKN